MDQIRPPQSIAIATEGQTILAVEKALAVVELLMRQSEPLSAREISDRVGINRTTTHRVLNALMQRGWIEKPSGTTSYRLSVRLLALTSVSGQFRDLLAELRPTLERLSALSRETVHVGVLDGYEVLHVDRIESREKVGVASPIGSRATAHQTGLGKALLAASPDPLIEDYADRIVTPDGDEALTRYWTDIAQTRQHGFSIDEEEYSIGVRCLGVAVRGGGGAPLFAISVTGPSPRFTLERALQMAPAVVAEVETVSRHFGWDGEAP